MELKLAIFSMFRSGSNYLWYLMSKDKRFEYSYTEPLHPNLRKERKHHKHYASYNDLEDFEKYFGWGLVFEKYIMSVDEDNDRLKNYLDYLIKPNTLIKINRMSFRIKWFQKNFSEVKCAGIIRDPRAFAMAHILNGAASWDSIFFDICLRNDKFKEYLEPFKKASVITKLLAFWRLCAEEMLHLPLITIEDLNRNRVRALTKLYRSFQGIVFIDDIRNNLVPDDYAFFWGDSTKYYDQITNNEWDKSIELTGIEDLMKRFGYE